MRRFRRLLKVDLVVASNVFHYSTDPSLWFGDVLGMTERFVLQDLVSRRRSGRPGGLCDDGDSLRYCFRAGGVESDFASPYDLTAFNKQIAYFEAFDGGRNEYHVLPSVAPRHYCAVLESIDRHAGRPRLHWSQADYLRLRLPCIKMITIGFMRRLRSRGAGHGLTGP